MTVRAAASHTGSQESAGRSDFLSGGGDMGARMRALDWSATPLGSAERWPQSLKTIIRVMLDSRYAMWMLWGPELTFFCNDAYLPTVGNKRDWVLGARSDRVWEEIWPDIGPRIQHVLRSGEATWDEGLLLFLERRGFPEETYHTFSYSPVYDDLNRIAGMLCVVTEVTDRVIGERRLRVLSDLAAQASGVDSVELCCQRTIDVLSKYPLDLPLAALYLLDPSGEQLRCVSTTRVLPQSLLPKTFDLRNAGNPWNPAAAIATGLRHAAGDLPAQGIGIAAGPWPDLIQNGYVLPLKGTGPGGVSGALVVGVSPRRPQEGAFGDFLDLISGQIAAAIADAQAFEKERARAEALAELDRAKTAFFSNVSHEFRTPLTLMLAPVEDALADGLTPAPVREKLEVAQRNAQRLLRLVNSLLDFSRIEAGRIQSSYEPTDLGAVTRDLASTFRSAIERAGLRFDVEVQPLPESVYVDRGMWEKVVLNLLSNAFKFTLDGAITVRVRPDGNHAALDVEDTGVGVPEQHLPHLFERFYRVEGSRGRNFEGSGIGLALVQELVKHHGGSIEAVSALGVGTTFKVRIPMGLGHLPRESIRDTAPSRSAAQSASAYVQEAERWLPAAVVARGAEEQWPRFGDTVEVHDRRFTATFGARIVLADDNADMLGYVLGLLSPYYEVEAVGDGAAALMAIRRERPELVISDVMMPKVDGFELLRRVRSETALSGLPLILLSARAGEESRIEGLGAGADDYLIKPFSARELLARVGAILERTRLRSQNEVQLRESESRLTRALEAVTATEQQFRATFETVAVGMARVRLDGRWLLVNDRFCEITGYSREELLQRSFADITHPDDLGIDFEKVGELRSGEITTYGTEKRYIRKDGKLVWVNLTVSLVRDPDGEPLYLISVIEDITERKHAEEELRRAGRLKDEFLAMLAHELRNPLAPIRNASEILARSLPSDDNVQSPLGMIIRQTAHLTRLVDDLLDVSRITQGRIQLQRQPVNLASIVTQAVETVSPLIRERAHTLSTTTRTQKLYVDGDSARLVQCVVNILNNAAKYTDTGGRILIETRDEGDDALIAISDNGIGISAELLPRVFDLFVQGDRTLDRAQGGLGIGLSVVSRLIDMHGGQVAARSDGLGHGSLFEIRLPRIGEPQLQPPANSHANGPARRVLIVDDNVDSADSLAMVLKFDGHETDLVYTSREAVNRALVFRPDIVLLDIGLPDIDGYEVARRMRASPQLNGVRLVALTGYGQPEDRMRTREAGFDDHLVKPVEFGALARAIAAASRGN